MEWMPCKNDPSYFKEGGKGMRMRALTINVCGHPPMATSVEKGCGKRIVNCGKVRQRFR